MNPFINCHINSLDEIKGAHQHGCQHKRIREDTQYSPFQTGGRSLETAWAVYVQPRFSNLCDSQQQKNFTDHLQS